MISVVMGVCKIDDYLLLAMNSILSQSYKDFEFIVVVNGANCQSISQFIKDNTNDNRLIVLETKIPQLAFALNLAIDKAKYEYIARMDSDDIAEPLRLEKQLEFIVENNLDLVGSSATLINSKGNKIGARQAIADKLIDKRITYKNSFIHPTTMYKKDFFFKVRGYNSGFNSEDYDLWLRMKRNGVRWANMKESLLQYRVHEQASQGQLLGYAEAAGYSLREFILNKSINGFLAIFYKVIKIFIIFNFKSKSSKSDK